MFSLQVRQKSSTCFRALCSTDLQGKKPAKKINFLKERERKKKRKKKRKKEREEEDKKGFESALTVKPYRSLSHYFDVKTSLSVFLSVCFFFLSIVVCFSLSVRPFCFFFLLLFLSVFASVLIPLSFVVSLCLCVRLFLVSFVVWMRIFLSTTTTTTSGRLVLS